MNESARTTIVGARPPAPGRPAGSIPLGIEVLVKKASIDSAFRAALLERRAAVAAEIGLELTPSESALLCAVPEAQLATIIDNSKVPLVHRRAFLGYMAAAMLAALTAELTGCQGEDAARSPGPSPTPARVVVQTQVVEKGAVQVTTSTARPPRLDTTLGNETARSVTVRVHYDSPFQTGEVSIHFVYSRTVAGAEIAYEPAPSVPVGRESGELRFTASALSGVTKWLIVGLRLTADDCSGLTGEYPPNDSLFPRYVENACGMWQVIEFDKTWRAEASGTGTPESKE